MNRTLARAMAWVLVLIVSFTTAPLASAQDGTAQTPAPTTPETNPSNHKPAVELPENPGQSNRKAPAAEQPAKPEPNGTAVAPKIETSGGAASKPAGVALAPPKQKRVRSLLIKLGVLAGAGIAIGTVAGLSAASPSRVPNSPGH